MFEKPVTPSHASSEDLLDARKKFEAEKLTRRSALKKFGITSGMALFGMFAADDLARMVIKKMEQNEATRQIAEVVAQEFKNAGVVFASPSPYYNPCAADGDGTTNDPHGCGQSYVTTCKQLGGSATCCNLCYQNGMNNYSTGTAASFNSYMKNCTNACSGGH